MHVSVAQKMNMTQYFAESGEVIPVTVLKIPKQTVLTVKTSETKDGYEAVAIAFPAGFAGTRRNLNKSLTGQLKNHAGMGSVLEFRIPKNTPYETGQSLEISSFTVGDLVNCQGVMKGRGFAGAMKRHNFSGFPASHGHDRPRSVGSIGQRFPQHTRKGLRMAGHMGAINTTVKNLQVVSVDAERGLLMVRGAVPGANGGLVKIYMTGVNKPLIKEVKASAKKK